MGRAQAEKGCERLLVGRARARTGFIPAREGAGATSYATHQAVGWALGSLRAFGFRRWHAARRCPDPSHAKGMATRRVGGAWVW